MSFRFILLVAALGLVVSCGRSNQAFLLNASYDSTRELYQDVNRQFSTHWETRTGEPLLVRQAHSGSGKQARAIIDGLRADVATLALAHDIDAIHRHAQFVEADWQARLPYGSTPFTSTVVFLVRRGNPKGIKDWNDLVRPGVSVITANPKTSGGARWNYLAAYGYGLRHGEGDDARARDFVRRLFMNVPVFDSSARAACTTFVQRKLGDVMLGWESEALMAMSEAGPDVFELVIPSLSILAEPPVVVVDRTVDRRGTRLAAEAYVQFLYTETVQEIAARHFYRPQLECVALKHRALFPTLNLLRIDEDFGGWEKAHALHFSEGGVFDEICRPAATRHSSQLSR